MITCDQFFQSLLCFLQPFPAAILYHSILLRDNFQYQVHVNEAMHNKAVHQSLLVQLENGTY